MLSNSITVIQRQLRDIERAIVSQASSRTSLPVIEQVSQSLSPPGRANPHLSPAGHKTARPLSSMINEEYVGNKSATNIQKIWKGFQTRKQMKKRNLQKKGKRLEKAQLGLQVIEEQGLESEITTQKLQNALCRYTHVKKTKIRDKAIRKIQNFWRSRRIHLLYQDIKLAIVMIQSAWRAYKRNEKFEFSYSPDGKQV